MEEAARHARSAYAQAWADGPPYCVDWNLREARGLLAQLGEAEPELRSTDPRDVVVPAEEAITALIQRLHEKAPDR